MKPLTLCLAVVLQSSVLLGGEPTIVIIGNGTAWFSRGDGSPTVLVSYIILPPGDVPDDPDDPDDPPNDETARRKRVKAWADAVGDADGAKVLAAAFKQLADAMQSGSVATDTRAVDASLAILVAVKIAGMPDGLKSKWRSVYLTKILTDLGTLVISNGGTLTKAQWVSFFMDVVNGLLDSAAATGSTQIRDMSPAQRYAWRVRHQPTVAKRKRIYVTDVATGRLLNP